MKIAVIGLGLIGGSLCKAIKRHTAHLCYGLDTDSKTATVALECKAIDGIIGPDELCDMDLSIVCLHPKQTISFLLEHAAQFRSGSIVIDVCGVKEAVVCAATGPLADRGVHFVGTHPMAGREFSGFQYSTDNLFDNASFIITPISETQDKSVNFVSDFAKSLRFQRVVISTPQEHDQIIAFTSQLAHVVSNAYVKSPSLLKQSGFSAGSFQDLTRVAKLNEAMWSSLFLLNREALLFELDTLIAHLKEYREALDTGDERKLTELLRDGRLLKEQSLEQK